MKISDLPFEQKPREKAIFYGIDTLSDGELLAILIGSGTKGKSALEIGNELLFEYQNLYLLSKENFSNLKKHKGISLANSLRLEACFEIAKRINKNEKIFLKQLSSPEDVFKLYSYLSKENTEKAVLVLLNKKRCIIKEKIIDGKYTSSVTITAKEIINEVLMSNAYYLVLIHNHPNEECDPSEDDNIATEYLLDILHTTKNYLKSVIKPKTNIFVKQFTCILFVFIYNKVVVASQATTA